MSRKKYALPKGISSEISNTVELVKNNIGSLNYNIVPLNAIEFDPKNPRQLSINRDELINGFANDDPEYAKKTRELEALRETAESIKRFGVRNAVEIYKHGLSYRLIHGERRCMSSILAGKANIPAKILDQKPSNFDIRLLQLIENMQRENLTLNETLNNLRQITEEYRNDVGQGAEINVAFLEKHINRSKPHCLNYLAVLNAPAKLQDAIKKGQINSLEKAAVIAKASSTEQRDCLLDLCVEGATLRDLKQNANKQRGVQKLSKQLVKARKNAPGRKASKINLGATQSIVAIKKLITLVAADPMYAKFNAELKCLPLSDYSQCASSFRALLCIMEKVEKA